MISEPEPLWVFSMNLSFNVIYISYGIKDLYDNLIDQRREYPRIVSTQGVRTILIRIKGVF